MHIYQPVSKGMGSRIGRAEQYFFSLELQALFNTRVLKTAVGKEGRGLVDKSKPRLSSCQHRATAVDRDPKCENS